MVLWWLLQPLWVLCVVANNLVFGGEDYGYVDGTSSWWLLGKGGGEGEFGIYVGIRCCAWMVAVPAGFLKDTGYTVP